MLRSLLAAPALVMLAACASVQQGSPPDPYLWLEEIESPRALEWVRARNAETLAEFEKDPRHARIERETRRILLADDRIPNVQHRAGYLYNFWQDKKSVRGLWRRTTLAEYAKPKPRWEILLDLDLLAKRESENWVWKGSACLPPDYVRCLLRLSRGGKDAVVVREFDIPARRFVPAGEGFVLKEAKLDVDWVDRDRILVATDFGEGSLTLSGYPRLVKLWKRGEPLEGARLVLEAERADMAAAGFTSHDSGGVTALLLRRKSFYEEQAWVLDPRTFEKRRLGFPDDADIEEVHAGQVIARLRSDWATGGSRFPAGAVVSLPLGGPETPQLVYAPDDRSAVQGVDATRDHLIVNVLTNVEGRLLRFRRKADGWSGVPIPGRIGTIDVMSADAFSEVLLTWFESFLEPPRVQTADGKVLRRLPPRFDAAGLAVRRFEATSRDGTRVPYFVVGPRRLKADGRYRVVLYGYGGFEIPITPFYLGVIGKLWAERGGIYVVANIRGGGEFGPRWHQAALKAGRQRAFDDFAAVAESLVARGITKPARLAIMGGSNGGLLVGAAVTQKPEAYGAAICRVPLLDMLRYNKLLAGHSWQAEYGDPDDAALRPAIAAYSPYQRVNSKDRYPKIFFLTSTKDDRVHPGHARKMVARMREMGHPVYYYENIEGGHGAAANLEQKIRMTSLEYVYLARQFGVLYSP